MEYSEHIRPGCDTHRPCQLIQRWLPLSLDPDMDLILAGRDISQMKKAMFIRDAVVRGGERKHDGTHFRVDIAEDIGDALAREAHTPARSRLIQAEVELLAIEE